MAAAHKYKNSWDTWVCVVGCDISSLTPPNTVGMHMGGLWRGDVGVRRGAGLRSRRRLVRTQGGGARALQWVYVVHEPRRFASKRRIRRVRASVVACVLWGSARGSVSARASGRFPRERVGIQRPDLSLPSTKLPGTLRQPTTSGDMYPQLVESYGSKTSRP